MSRWERVRLELLQSPRTSPEVPRTSQKLFGDFPGSSLTVELNSNPEVPRKFPRLSRKFPGLPRRSASLSGKPDTLSRLTKIFSDFCSILKGSMKIRRETKKRKNAPNSGAHSLGDLLYTPFANSYLPITFFSELIS